MQNLTSSSLIEQLRNSSSLVDGSLIADPLKSILVGLCDLVTQQQQEISNLQKSISNLTPVEKFNTAISELNNQFQETKTLFSREFQVISTNLTNIKDTIILPMQSSLMQSQNEFQNKAKEIEKSVSNQANLLFSQYSITTKNQKNQIDEVLSKFEKLNDDYACTKSIVDDLKIIDSRAIDERLIALDDTIKATEKKLISLSDKEEKFENYVNDQHNNVFNKNFSILFKDVDELKLLQQSRSLADDSIKITDTESLISAVERNSRRLDGVDQIISGIKLNYEDAKDIISSYRTVLLTFKQTLYEVSAENEESQKIVSKRLIKMAEFVDFVSHHLNQAYDFISTILKYQLNLSESSSKGFDQLKSIFHLLTKSSIPEFNFLYQSIDDQFTFNNLLTQTLTNDDVEGHMQDFKQAFKKKVKTVTFDQKQTENLNQAIQNIETENKYLLDKNTELENEEHLRSLAKRISNLDVPCLAGSNIDISLKNVECIKELFFRAEPMRLQLADLRGQIEALSSSLKHVFDRFDDSSGGIRSKLNEKADIDYVARAIEKTNKSVRLLRDEFESFKKKADYSLDFNNQNILNSHSERSVNNSVIEQSDLPLNQLTLSISSVTANAVANARGEGAVLLIKDNRGKRSQGARSNLSSISPPSRTRMNQQQQMQLKVQNDKIRGATVLQKHKPKLPKWNANTNLNGKKSLAKSAEISPRERIRIEDIKQEQVLVSSSMNNSPHYD